MSHFISTAVTRWLYLLLGILFIPLLPISSNAAGSSSSLSMNQALATVGSMDVASRPKGVPEDYLLTPNGYFPASCVQGIAEDERVLDDGIVERADGTRRTLPRCKLPHYTHNLERVEPDAPLSAISVKSNDAVAVKSSAAVTAQAATAIGDWAYLESSYFSSDRVSRIIASFTIPNQPALTNTVFYWPGINGATVMQPVIQWQNGSWTLASWNCCASGTTVHGPFVNAKPGDRGQGEIFSTCAPGVQCTNYVIKTRNLTTGQTSVLANTYYPTKGSTIYATFLEFSGPTAGCGRLPTDGGMVFHDVFVYDINFKKIASPPWSDHTGYAGCHESVKSTPTTMKLTYH
jgi:hypothetical protein